LKITSIHQFLPVLARYDAIGETVLRIQKTLHQWGYDSEIFVETPIDQTSDITKKYLDYQENNSDIVIYHHSIGSILADFTSKLKISKILFYHNITPPKFFEPYNKTIVSELYNGRQQTEKLAKFFDYAMAASNYNKSELYQVGFKQVFSMQYFIDLERFDKIKIKENIVQKYSKSKNIIFVGRRSPNKKIEDLLKVFAFFKIFNPDSNLFILGGSWSVEEYAKTLEDLLTQLHIKDNVVFVNTLTDEELASYYKISHVFLCMSEHEGFCIPLLEAMYFGLPIIAYNSSAVPDTLGGSGILVNHKKYGEIAEIISIIINDKNLAEKIIFQEKERLKSFSMQNASDLLKKNLSYIIQNTDSNLFSTD
jgi:glycosyltransferase involved in cell wall biosynthesis